MHKAQIFVGKVGNKMRIKTEELVPYSLSVSTQGGPMEKTDGTIRIIYLEQSEEPPANGA
jgi:hypothetical protein